MRLAIVSDLHANQPAWEAVWLDVQATRPDRILCLGDVIGYGPSPDAVLQHVHAHVHHFVMGNHDAAVCGKLDDSLFSENARRSLAWSRKRLNRTASDFFAQLPLALKGPGFRCVHGGLPDPDRFDYLLEPEQAIAAWNAFPEPLLFVGHTHQPALFRLSPDGTLSALPIADFQLAEGFRYIINPGSVGLSRDGDPRAAWCLYDTDAQTISFRRIPFDLDRFRRDLEHAGLADTLDWFFEQDPRKGAHPVRAVTGFRPPTKGESGVRDAIPESPIGDLRRKAARWRSATVAVSAVLILSVLFTALLFHFSRQRLEIRPGINMEARVWKEREPLLTLPLPAPPGAPLLGWDLSLGNRYRQALEWINADGSDSPMLQLRSKDGQSELHLISAPLHVEGLATLTLEGEARKSPDFSGTFVFALTLIRANEAGGEERLDPFLIKEPVQLRRDGWRIARQTINLPARSKEVRLVIRGRFVGAVEIRRLELRGRPPTPSR